MKIQNVLYGMLLMGLMASVGFATSGNVNAIQSGLCELYSMVSSLLAVVVFILIVVAAIIYAAGQVMGAETRARASVWATSMIIGAVIGIVIYLLVPIILGTMLGESDLTTKCATGSSSSSS